MIREIDDKNKEQFNKLALHPLQSWEWGEFRKKTGIEVVRLGRHKEDKLIETAQITIHQIPFTKYTIGYFPKGNAPSQEMIKALTELGKKYNCIFIKLEPNIQKDIKILRYEDIKTSPHPLFTKYTFQLDLTKSEEELLKNMYSKTRYNIRVAEKHGVMVKQDDSNKAFETYLALMQETTKRQKYFAHTEHYHRLMWETLEPSGIAHLLEADYQGQTLVSWVVFLFNGILYYPYGASSNLYRNVMASNLMMWEVIKWGKKNGAKLFDMWGALGPDPNPEDSWYGFHRFKQGYGVKHIEFIGSYDLVINRNLYMIYNLLYNAREIFLRLKSYF